MIVRQGIALAVVATAIGLMAAAALTRFMASLLFDVAPNDLGIFATVAATLGAVAIVATLVPAARAMRADPTAALRET
jgi:ABC-type antimicrobial peptide transport system permease subunit